MGLEEDGPKGFVGHGIGRMVLGFYRIIEERMEKVKMSSGIWRKIPWN